MLKLEVLSGGLSGRTFQFDQTEVRLGRHPACEIAFDALRDDSVGRWHAHLRPEGKLWSVENLHENGTFLNGKPVAGKLPLHSGDSLRLARDGPEIRVTIVAPAAQPAARAEPVPLHHEDVTAIPLSPAPNPMPAGRPLPPSRPSSALNAWIAICAVGFSVIAISAVLLVSRHLVYEENGNVQQQTGSSARNRAESAAPESVSKDTSRFQPKSEVAAPPVREKPESSDPWRVIEQRNRAAVYTLAAEEPNGVGMWPMGTAAAIRRDVMVSTASLAAQLERLKREGWKIWALGSETNSAREVSEMQVHIGFVKSSEKPEQQAFFDLALLTLDATASEFLKVATSDELAELDSRQPFGCLAISLPIDDPKDPPEPIGRFDVLVPEMIKGKIQGILQVSRDPGAPRMLLLPASMPTHIWGSPVLNENGKLIAVCTEAAQKTETGQVRLNYAPLVTGVADWLKNQAKELWVPVP